MIVLVVAFVYVLACLALLAGAALLLIAFEGLVRACTWVMERTGNDDG